MHRRPTFEPQSIIDVLSERNPVEQYHLLQVIWLETSQISEWGFYFAFYPQGVDVIAQLNDITRRAYHCLRAGANAEFAERLADAYRLILISAQTYMVEKYKFTEALSVQVPSRDS